MCPASSLILSLDLPESLLQTRHPQAGQQFLLACCQKYLLVKVGRGGVLFYEDLFIGWEVAQTPGGSAVLTGSEAPSLQEEILTSYQCMGAGQPTQFVGSSAK